jgi:uncharacterized protein (DUF433 family)
MTTKPKPAAKVAAKANSRVREAVFETVSAFQAVDSIGQVKVPNAEIRAAMEESHAKVQAVKMAAVLVSRDPDILGGTPVFKGTRVPVAVLFENLGDGKSLDEILISYPTLSRENCASDTKAGSMGIPQFAGTTSTTLKQQSSPNSFAAAVQQ